MDGQGLPTLNRRQRPKFGQASSFSASGPSFSSCQKHFSFFSLRYSILEMSFLLGQVGKNCKIVLPKQISPATDMSPETKCID